MTPGVLLFDEVTPVLDPEPVGGVLTAMKDQARNGAAIVVVTLEMAFAQDLADRVTFMDRGEVPARSRNPRTRSFLIRFRDARAGM